MDNITLMKRWNNTFWLLCKRNWKWK